MNVSLVITVLGPDRPGLVSALASRASDCGANWLESSMAQLCGKFAGIVRLEVEEAALPRLESALRGLDAEGLQLTIERAACASTAAGSRAVEFEVVGNDRPGIVREISTALAHHGASIDRLDTSCESASFSGEAMFRAQLAVHLPGELEVGDLQHALEALANELMVDITLEESQTT